MNGRAQDILFEVPGQSLIWDAPEGRPTNVSSVKVFPVGTGDEGTAEDAIAGSASIDLVSTTVDAASGDGQADPRKLNVAATSNMVVGQSYLVTSADGLTEWPEVVEIDSGNYVRTRYPMANAFASADTVVGTRLAVPLKTAWVSEQNKLTGGRDPIRGWRVRWVYTVASRQYIHDAAFDLVRYAGGHTLTAADVDREFPGMAGMGPGFHRTDGYRGLLDQAYQRLRFDLVDVDLADNSVMDQDVLNRATLLAFGVLVAKSRVLQGGDLRLLEMASEDYEGFLSKTIRASGRVAIAADSTGAGARVSMPSLWKPR